MIARIVRAARALRELVRHDMSLDPKEVDPMLDGYCAAEGPKRYAQHAAAWAEAHSAARGVDGISLEGGALRRQPGEPPQPGDLVRVYWYTSAGDNAFRWVWLMGVVIEATPAKFAARIVLPVSGRAHVTHHSVAPLIVETPRPSGPPMYNTELPTWAWLEE